MNFPPRIIEKIIREICEEKNYAYEFLADGWIIKITKNNPEYIWGYNFPINSSSSAKICDDKAGTYQTLNSFGVDSFEHIYFLRNMVNDNELIEVFERFNNDVVVKPNFGSSGVNVERATDKDEFIKIVNKLMSQYSAIAVSPYYSYENEYRLIMLDGGCETSFLKQRTNSWKHNLAQGAIPKDISDTKLLSKLVEIAVKTCKALGIRFCSVDIAQIGQDIFKVVEVNSGVMMESFAKVDEEHYQQVKRIYSKALER